MKIIEVEKKVRLEPQQIQKIAAMASLSKESRIQDCYYDTPNYRYTSQNIWLRQREGAFELKVGIRKPDGLVDRYEEIVDEKCIAKYLDIGVEGELQTALSREAIAPFCRFVTFRRSYQLGDLKIDIDDADFGDLRYRVAEVEMIVKDLSQVQKAEQKIAQFVQEMGIDISIPVPPKLTYFLYCKRPEHYHALVQSKVIPHEVIA